MSHLTRALWAAFDLASEVGQVAVRNPVRTGLTALGVFWGTFMLVLMLGFGTSLERGVMRSMGGYATNAVYIWGQGTSLPYGGHQPGRRIRFRNADQPLLASLPGVSLAAPRNQLGGYRDGTPVRRGEHTAAFQVMGDVADFAQVMNVTLVSGRFVNPLDEAEVRKVAVVGREVERMLFPELSTPGGSLGEWIEVRGVAFRIVGVFRANVSGEMADRQESSLHIPLPTFQRVFHAGDRVGWFALLAAPDASGAEVQEQALEAMRRRHQVHPDDRHAIGSRNAEKEFAKLQNLFGGIRWLVWVVGAATLASGVVGVSNILLIVVRERTSEIGLRRALGATPASIVRLVLLEALALTTVSGYAGLVVGIGLIELLALQIGPNHPDLGQPSVDLGAALGAVVLLALAGLAAGWLPARRALAVNPVEALRTE
jgi:putative ABC transport system permease protein